MRGPSNDSYDRSPSQFDDLTDEELQQLINGTGKVKVSRITQPAPKKHVDLTSILGGLEPPK